MKNIIPFILFLIVISAITSCKSTEEAQTDNRPTLIQMQQFQEQQESQQRQQDGAERSGLTQEDIQILNKYADQNADLVCKLKDLDKTASEALSPSAEQEIKGSVVIVEEQRIALNKEIDEFCKNNDRRIRYYHMISKEYLRRCE